MIKEKKMRKKRDKKLGFFLTFIVMIFSILITVHQGCGDSDSIAIPPPTTPAPVGPDNSNSFDFPYYIKAKGKNNNLNIIFEIRLGLNQSLVDIEASGSSLKKVSVAIQYIWKLDEDFCDFSRGEYLVERRGVELEVSDDNSRIYVPSFEFSSSSKIFSGEEFLLQESNEYGEEDFDYAIVGTVYFQIENTSNCSVEFN